MNATQVLVAVGNRHTKDLYTEELCCGPGGSPRLDAWAMTRSWSNFTTHGYEVKVSRGDWLHNQKLEGYADYVHRLWVVCPWKLIDPSEVSEMCGLLWVTKKGARAVMKKKAPLLDPQHWTEPLRSAVFNRGEVKRQTSHLPTVDRRAVLRDWMEGNKDDWMLGRVVSKKIGAMFSKIRSMERELGSLRPMAEALREAGYYRIQDAIDAAGGHSDPAEVKRLKRMLSSVRDQLVRVTDQIDTKG